MKRCFRILSFSFVAIALLTRTGPALAEQLYRWEFEVPYDFKDLMPECKFVRILAEMGGDSAAGPTSLYQNKVTLPVPPDGNLSGNCTLIVYRNVEPRTTPPDKWGVRIVFSKDGETWVLPDTPGEEYKWTQAREGSQPNYDIRGATSEFT